MRLSENFHLSEFTTSHTATNHRINNTPGEREIENLSKLVINVLQPLRSRLGAPITILSGYRSPELNTIIKGAENSQHIKGEAADLRVYSRPLQDVYLEIADDLEFDQVIYEFGEWIHVSYREGSNRQNKLVAKKINGKTVYQSFTGSFE